MPEICTCGAKLPPDALFCHKCGKPQFEEPEPELEAAPALVEPAAPLAAAAPEAPVEISFQNRLALRSAFIGSLNALLLFLLLLPLLSLAIFVSFLVAGFLAAYLYRRASGRNLTLGNGAKMGWITGVFSFTLFIVYFTANMVVASYQGGLSKLIDDLRTQLSATQGGDAARLLHFIDQPYGLAVYFLASLAISFLFLTILPALGGALGAKLFTKER